MEEPAAEDRRESGGELYALLLQVPAAITVRRGPELRCVFQNAASLEILDQRGKTPKEVWPDHDPTWYAHLVEVATTGRAFVDREVAITRVRKPSEPPTTKYWDISFAPWRLPDGRIDGVVTVLFDVTDRVTARQRAEIAEERRRLALDAASVGTWRVDLATLSDTRDSALNRILGLPEVETTQPLDDFIARVHPDDRAYVVRAIDKALADGEDYGVEMRIVRPDGTIRWLRDLGRVVRDDAGKPIAFTGAAADITDLRVAQEQSERAHQRLGAALEASRIGTYTFDLRTGEVGHDVGVSRLFGFGIDERRSFEDFAGRIHPDDRTVFLAAVERSLRDGTDFHQEYRIVTPNGIRWLLDKAHVVRDESGPAFAIGAVVDITEQKHLAEAALAASVAKDEFIAMLSHELRNPLAPIVTALDIMKMRGDPVTRERRTIERQVAHLTRLVDDLLDISRATRGMIELTRERLPIRDVIGKAIEMASPLIEQKQHHISVDVPGGLWVYGDAVRLAQVFANLLTNAARYTNAGGRIEVAAELEGRRIRVSVRDTGIGMDADLLPRVFDIFVQGGDRGRARSEGGLGIGLALVRNLVALHGGTAAAYSEGLGKGSTFVVELDAVRPDHVTENDLTAARRAGSGARVLVVDDNTDAAALLAEALRAYGHEVAVAHDGPQALSIAEGFAPDAAVLDIGLPVMDGYELARRLRERGCGSCRFVALTGYGQQEDRARSDAAGFAAHLVKPVDIERLVEVLALTRS